MTEQEQPIQQSPQLHLPEGSSLRLTDGTHDLEVRKDGKTLFMQVSREKQNLFSIAVTADSQVHQIFNAAAHTTDSADPLPSQDDRETVKAPEYPPITIEGFTGRTGAYKQSDIRPGEMEYYVYLYYRPVPDNENWKFTIPYHVHFFGDLAENLNQQTIATGARLRVSGELHTRESKSKQGGEPKTHYDIYANQFAFFKGKPRPMDGETRKQG